MFYSGFSIWNGNLALFLSDVLGSYSGGFGSVALIYLFLAIIVYYTKDKYIEKVIINFTVKNYFTKLADKDEEDEKI